MYIMPYFLRKYNEKITDSGSRELSDGRKTAETVDMAKCYEKVIKPKDFYQKVTKSGNF